RRPGTRPQPPGPAAAGSRTRGPRSECGGGPGSAPPGVSDVNDRDDDPDQGDGGRVPAGLKDGRRGPDPEPHGPEGQDDPRPGGAGRGPHLPPRVALGHPAPPRVPVVALAKPGVYPFVDL